MWIDAYVQRAMNTKYQNEWFLNMQTSVSGEDLEWYKQNRNNVYGFLVGKEYIFIGCGNLSAFDQFALI